MTLFIDCIQKKAHVFILLCPLAFLNPLLTTADAAECKFPKSEGHGNATSEQKAKRNARISLEKNLRRAHPGDSKRYLSKGIEYKCKKSVLWQCRAKAKVCS